MRKSKLILMLIFCMVPIFSINAAEYRLGLSMHDVERRIEAAKAVGEHKTSMLHDLERDRPMEIDALVKSVQELGVLTKTATPTIDTVLALIQLRAKTAGLYHP